MCGICGEVYFDNMARPDPFNVSQINQALHHRGPDDSGISSKMNVIFGHRRLSIIDLTSGKQPMQSANGDLLLTYNGEIYNYIELRRELDQLGYSFRTTSDTEVLLCAYQEWGEECVSRLNGMFAFAIYDFHRRKLFCARDPFGQKPFFYTVLSDRLVFASELTALMRHPAVSRTVSMQGLLYYLSYEGYLHPNSAIEGVQKLPPGYSLSCQGGEVQLSEYWDLVGGLEREKVPNNLADAEDKLDHLLDESLERHMRSDVPIGIFLSGGLDSNSLLAYAKKIQPSLKTFTIQLGDKRFDESEEARLVARQFGTDHCEVHTSAQQLLDSIPLVLDKMDEPLADPGLVAKFQVTRLARQHMKVALGGDGGDELLAGYGPFRALKAARMFAHLPGYLQKGIKHLSEYLPAGYGYMAFDFKVKRFLRGFPAPTAARHQLWFGAFSPSELTPLLQDGNSLAAMTTHENTPQGLYGNLYDLDERVGSYDDIFRLLYQYQKVYLPTNICSNTDKSSMSVSMEVRSPFLDIPLVNYLNRLPSEWKLRGGQSKWILRRVLSRHNLPSAILNKKKQGFTIPFAPWFRSELKEFVYDLLDPTTLQNDGFFNKNVVSKLVDDHMEGRANNYKQIWSLVVFQYWFHYTVKAARTGSFRDSSDLQLSSRPEQISIRTSASTQADAILVPVV